MKCPCGERFYKSNAEGGVTFYFRRMLIHKGGGLSVVCNRCGKAAEPNPEMLAVLKSAVLLKAGPVSRPTGWGQE